MALLLEINWSIYKINSIKKINVDLDVLKEERRKNFKGRTRSIKYWAEYIKTHSDEEWSATQKNLIDSQFEKSQIDSWFVLILK